LINRNLALSSIAALAGFLTATSAAQAGKMLPYVSNSETMLSIGIQYDFGDMQLDLVAAARSTTTDTDNDVTGGKVDLTIPLTGENHAPTIRAMGLAGSTDVQGEAGLGYDFGKSQSLIGAGAQGPYVNGGFNYYFGGILAPYLGLNTLEDAPSRNVYFAPVC
jgi:hypothetical protein